MHVAAIMENPEVMMVLRAAEGDVDLRHGGFRRSVIHESCCWDPSGLCLKVLLTSKDTAPPVCVESDEEYKVSGGGGERSRERSELRRGPDRPS